MIGILLAGGRGKRLRPITDHIPKPMVPLLGKPLLDYNLNVFKRNKIYRVIMTVCYKKEVIQQHAGFGHQNGLDIEYIEECEPLGTAGSLFASKGLFKETLAVLSGDALTNIPLRQAYNFHKEKGARVTIVTARAEHPEHFGVCLTDQSGKLLSFLEKPSNVQLWTNQVSTGIYLVEPSLFEDYALYGKADFAQDVFPMLLANQEPVYVYETNAYWQDIGTHPAYKLAEKRLKRGIPGITNRLQPVYPLSNTFPASILNENDGLAERSDCYSPMLKKQAGISDEKVLL
ncbi:nucleotidyltransferase family protein [Domibacillus indicus]|uniref:nucleotidyltransferase family protein n=1 Tax=Domibacillus indicus TaxID=1437523 RepID=UPI00203E7E14|nr:nucleotidyltransferase family protein [Domibacillus indicus]MCM3788429.1 nucleotidyltransferase family protein [Domibacillus indicus]